MVSLKKEDWETYSGRTLTSAHTYKREKKSSLAFNSAHMGKAKRYKQENPRNRTYYYSTTIPGIYVEALM